MHKISKKENKLQKKYIGFKNIAILQKILFKLNYRILMLAKCENLIFILNIFITTKNSK